jgi:hypothetical protein
MITLPALQNHRWSHGHQFSKNKPSIHALSEPLSQSAYRAAHPWLGNEFLAL